MPVCIVCRKAPKRSELEEALRPYPEIVLLGHNGGIMGTEVFIENGEVEMTEEANRIYAKEVKRLFYLDFIRGHMEHNPKWGKRWIKTLSFAKHYLLHYDYDTHVFFCWCGFATTNPIDFSIHRDIGR